MHCVGLEAKEEGPAKAPLCYDNDNDFECLR